MHCNVYQLLPACLLLAIDKLTGPPACLTYLALSRAQVANYAYPLVSAEVALELAVQHHTVGIHSHRIVSRSMVFEASVCFRAVAQDHRP